MNYDAWIGMAGFAGLLFIILTGVPIGIAMAVVGLIGLWVLIDGYGALSVLKVIGLQDLTNYNLSVIPLFIIMGLFASRAGLSARLFGAAHAFVGHYRGGLTFATIGASAAFSAICGSSLATAATMAKVALPEMKAKNYEDGFAAGTVAAGGTLGILIPPSIMLLLYAITTETSIVDLFAAALVPGVLAVLFYLLTIGIVTRMRPGSAPASAKSSWKERLNGLSEAASVIVLFLLVIGGLYTGLFTPVESAAVGALATILYFFLSGRASKSGDLKETILECAGTSVMIFLIVVGAGVFSFFMAISGLPRVFAEVITAAGMPPYVVLLAILMLYLVLGSFMDSIGMMILTIPVIFPLVQALAPDIGMTATDAAVWFGIFVVIVIEIGLMTPPLGLNVFVIHGAARHIPMASIYRGVAPFWLADIVRLLLIVAFPGLVLWLPKLL